MGGPTDDPSLRPGEPTLHIVTYGKRYSWARPHDLDLDWDLLLFRDPAAGPLKDHDGRNPEIMIRLVHHEGFADWLRDARQEFEHKREQLASEPWRRSKGISIGFFCKAGRHRSVAGALLFQHIAQQEGYKTTLRHLTLHLRQCSAGLLRQCCPDCTSTGSPKATAAYDEALRLWQES